MRQRYLQVIHFCPVFAILLTRTRRIVVCIKLLLQSDVAMTLLLKAYCANN